MNLSVKESVMVFGNFLLLGLAAAYSQAPPVKNRPANQEHNVWPTIPEDKTSPYARLVTFDSPDSVVVSWSTYAKQNQSCVLYGTSKGNLTEKACSNVSVTYPTSRVHFNHVKLSPLKSGATYYYEVQTGNSTASKVNSFKTALAAGDDSPFNFTIYGDMGLVGEDGMDPYGDGSAATGADPVYGTPPYHLTIESLQDTADLYDWVAHIGDYAYADDWYYNFYDAMAGEMSYEAILEQFFSQLSPISGNKPYMGGPGNHEGNCQEAEWANFVCPLGQNNFTDFRTRFGAVTPGFNSTSNSTRAKAYRQKANSMSKAPMWYSFDYGLVHYVSINTETDFKNAPDSVNSTASDGYGMNDGPFGDADQQLNWLKYDLESVDRALTPWVIVGGHRPWYGGQSVEAQNAFESLFYEYGVDLAVFGHVHNTQLIAPQYKGELDDAKYKNPKAPVYVITGGAGNIEGQTTITDGSWFPGLDWANSDAYMYTRVEIHDDQNLKLNFVRSSDNVVLRTQTLYKEHGDQFVKQ